MSNFISYQNGNYQVYLDLDTGTKIRCTQDDYYEAEYPESIDIKITNKCNMNCLFCHENSTISGSHADLSQSFVDTIKPYTEIAIGGGNVLSHSNLEDFLIKLKSLRCVPSITVNQVHFLSEFDYIRHLYNSDLVYGIGVSLIDPSSELIEKMRLLPTSVLHTINGILTLRDIELLSNNDLKILVLGYKSIRRGEQYLEDNLDRIHTNMTLLSKNLDRLFDSFKIVSFDNLALEQLPIREYVGENRWKEFYMGDDGDHTFYIDMVNQEYAISSTSLKRFPIANHSVRDMFQHIKSLNK